MVAQLTAEDFANLTIPENMRISRDGKLVMYTVRNLTRNDPEPLKSAIWIAEIGKENSARGLVPASFTVNVPAFSPNGESIAFISNLAVSFLKLDNPSDVTQLTSVAKHGYVSAFRWSQNGKRIVFAAQPKDETSPSDVKIYGENLRYSNLLNVTLDSQEVSKLIDAKAHVVNFELNAEGNKVYYCTRSASDFHSGYHGQDIRVLDLSSQVPTSIYRTPYRIGGFSLSGETVVLGSPFNIDEEYFHHSPSIHLIKDGRDVWHVYGEKNDVASLQTSWNRPAIFVQERIRTSFAPWTDKHSSKRNRSLRATISHSLR